MPRATSCPNYTTQYTVSYMLSNRILSDYSSVIENSVLCCQHSLLFILREYIWLSYVLLDLVLAESRSISPNEN